MKNQLISNSKNWKEAENMPILCHFQYKRNALSLKIRTILVTLLKKSRFLESEKYLKKSDFLYL